MIGKWNGEQNYLDKNLLKMTKEAEYTQKILSQLVDIFSDECDNYIRKEDILEEDHATDFFHAITLASGLLYNRLTGDNVDALGYNHIANRLICQKSKVSKD